VNNIAFSDWKRDGAWWFRSSVDGSVYVTDQAERSVFCVLVCGTLLGGRFTCPDAAREAADAHLVSQGRLPAERAFVRLGEWEPSAPKGYWARVGGGGGLVAMGHEREGADAAAVKLGLLDPSRAFKAPTEADIRASITNAVASVYKSRRYDSMTRDESFRHEYLCEPLEPAKPAWGEWERIGIAFVRQPSDRGAVPIAAYVDRWELGGNRQALATDIDDAREKADAFLVARGELEAGWAFKRVGDWTLNDSPVVGWHRASASQRDYARVRPNGWEAWDRLGTVAHGNETGDAGKAAADAELVRRGLLAEERAFKVAEPFTFKGIAEFDTYTLGPSVVGTCEVSHDDGATWQPAQAGVTLGPKSRLRYKAQTSSPAVKAWAMPVVPDALDAPPRDHAHEVIHKGAEPVTLANWEHHLPELLDNAPREFRDGFNRRQGPAWEAYLRALARLKEEMQFGRHARLNIGGAIEVAAMVAREWLGLDWCRANYNPEGNK
jgi:hypothetical protein